MSEPKSSKQSRPLRRADPRTLRRFVEELSWLLSSFEDLDFKALSTVIEESQLSSSTRSTAKARRTENIQLLGRLPALFMDDELFSGNEDIVEFAKHALGIEIPRWHKKSKYELIGHVVCNANLLNDRRLRQLGSAIEKLQDDRGQARHLIQNQRRSGLSWNEVIQTMLTAI